MKFNKWTLGLAAVGVVSLASAARADDTANTASTVLTSLSATTLSGYVDTSAQWNLGTGNTFAPPVKFNPGKQDGFNLDVVQLSVAKALDESEWAAGYRVDLWAGPDANVLGTQSTMSASDFAIRQAYVALRTPVGNGIDWKVGVFDSIIGYESVAAPNNPNYTRSYGHSIEPQTHTGILGSYRVSDNVSLAVGMANTVNSAINSRAPNGSTGVAGGPLGTALGSLLNAAAVTAGGTFAHPAVGSNARAESYKSYMASLALTAPDSMGFLSGSTFYGGVVGGYNNSVLGTGLGNSQWNAYIGSTLATPVTGLRLGAAFDYLGSEGQDNAWLTSDASGGTASADLRAEVNAYALALYMSYQATEKLSLHARGEYLQGDVQASSTALAFNQNASVRLWAFTATAQYDLWKNVLSRVEFRWDHTEHGRVFGGVDPSTGGPNRENAFMLAANVVYKF
jgi:hypothetical protein